MNLEIFNQEDKSGTLRKEKIVIKKYPEEHNHIIEWCMINRLAELSFKLKVYHCINNLKQIPECYCGKDVLFKNSDAGYNTYCSTKCQNISDEVKNKRKETNIERFGTDKPQQLDSIKQKSIKTNNERYGVDYAITNIDIKQKSIDTLIANYGVDNPNKSKEILEKRVTSFKANIAQYKETYKQTSLTKYGVKHPWMVADIHQKGIDERKAIQHKIIQDSVIEYCNMQHHELINIDWNIKEITCKCDKIHEYKITNYLFHKRKTININTCTICNKLNQYSGEELNLLKFIEDNYNGDIIKRDRKILNGKELDIYLPALNLAFEFNGLYWHSEANKSIKYHYEKSVACKEKGIHLIHVFEDDWELKKDIIKSIILNKLNKSNMIYARKCEIKLVDNAIAKIFLNINHMQGYIPAKINIGLYHNNELISLMTFGQLRTNLGSKSKDGCYELYRMCNKLNTAIIGGANKLFKYFIRNYNYTEIITYCNNSLYTGDMYIKLGFQFDKFTGINYWWIVNDRKSNRYNWRKDKLIKLGYDSTKSEVTIMHDLGCLRIYDCGANKYTFKH